MEWAKYFLNASNHDSDVADAVSNGAGYIGYHAYPTQKFGPYDTKDDLTHFFSYVSSLTVYTLLLQAIDTV